MTPNGEQLSYHLCRNPCQIKYVAGKLDHNLAGESTISSVLCLQQASGRRTFHPKFTQCDRVACGVANILAKYQLMRRTTADEQAVFTVVNDDESDHFLGKYTFWEGCALFGCLLSVIFSF